jgi:argininosuccinate lyase
MSQKTKLLKDETTDLLDEFNASIMFDKELYSQDIKGSIAHSQMLCEQGIINQKEQEDIESGLLQVKKEIEAGEFLWNIKDEDIHMAIETRLTDLIGDAGKKLHTARSRNDQVATDFRLYVQEKNKSIMKQLKTVVQTFVDVAEKNTQTLIPGMTHLQHAQPINFGYHMLAYANMFKRDFERFESSHKSPKVA